MLIFKSLVTFLGYYATGFVLIYFPGEHWDLVKDFDYQTIPTLYSIGSALVCMSIQFNQASVEGF